MEEVMMDNMEEPILDDKPECPKCGKRSNMILHGEEWVCHSTHSCPDLRQVIKIAKILNHGGSCPFQIDALTDDDRLIYGRYRHGYLRVYIGKAGDLFLTEEQVEVIVGEYNKRNGIFSE